MLQKVSAKRSTRFAVALITIALLAAFGRGGWIHQVASYGALLWIGAPLLVAAVVFAIKRQFETTMSCVAIVAVLALQLAAGMGFMKWDIYRSQQYCESLVPILDEIFLAENRYPSSLDAERQLPAPPSWQFDTGLIHYYSDGSTFTFEVSNPAEMFGGFIYRHDARYWEEWRD